MKIYSIFGSKKRNSHGTFTSNAGPLLPLGSDFLRTPQTLLFIIRDLLAITDKSEHLSYLSPGSLYTTRCILLTNKNWRGGFKIKPEKLLPGVIGLN